MAILQHVRSKMPETRARARVCVSNVDMSHTVIREIRQSSFMKYIFQLLLAASVNTILFLELNVKQRTIKKNN